MNRAYSFISYCLRTVSIKEGQDRLSKHIIVVKNSGKLSNVEVLSCKKSYFHEEFEFIP
jgi:hypothetical protein